jgi:predicted nucleic acid-binding protein
MNGDDGYLLDTNVLSELTTINPEPRVATWLAAADPSRLYTSVLSIGEIVRGIELLALGRRRTQIQEWLDTVLPSWFDGRVLSVDRAIAERWGELTAQARVRGEPVDVVDGLLAATALQHKLTMVTRNAKHFLGAGVVVLNPWIWEP